MNHKEAITLIRGLDWRSFDPLSIVYVSLFTAQEFATSLRKTLEIFPDAKALKEMANGELQTDNMQYGDYNRIGDHWEFLQHFLADTPVHARVYAAYQKYENAIRQLKLTERAMTIISRERELPNIFLEILTAHEWERLGFGYYLYYLKRHIELDTQEGGHAELTKVFSYGKKFKLDPAVLDRFWTARLKLYQEAFIPRRL